MKTRALGPSGLQVSEVGLGCNNFGGRLDEAGTRGVVHAALDAGINFFDTADSYGDKGGSEAWDGLADRLGRSGGARVTLIAPDGRVVGDSEVPLEELPRLENHAERPEVAGALARGTASSQRRSAATSLMRKRIMRCISGRRRSR